MARRKKYKLPSSTPAGSNWLYWAATAILLAVLGWIWFHTGRRTAQVKPATAHGTPARPAPVHPPAPVSNRVEVPSGPRTTRDGKWITPLPAIPPETARVQPLPRAPRDTFEAQLALAHLGISAGSLDGVMGSQTRAALRAFQQSNGLATTGELDLATRSRLLLETPPLVSYWVTSNDLARLQPVAATWLGKSQQSALDYETVLELVAEKFHAHPGLVRRLNPDLNWSNVLAGTEVRVPNAGYPEPAERAAFIRISLAGKTLQACGVRSNLLAHFPCSIAQRVEKRPVGELHVSAIAPNPNYTFNPEVFPESPEAQALGRKLILPPGPNNPVGVAWISLDRPGYGIHGTPGPEQVGRTESHGCFRLANWNAEYLLKLVEVGTPVWVEP